jgi:NitT/TauT family transport system substrate-binding protein
MKRRSIISSTLLLAMSLSVTVGCSSPGSEVKPSSSVSPNAVKVGFNAWPGFVPWQVTQEEQIFKAKQVDVDLQWFDSLPKSIAALSTGKLDANSQAMGDTVNEVMKGADLVIVLTNDNSTGNDAVIVSDKIKKIQDLKGKKVAAEAGTVDHFLLAQGLRKAGMKMSDIQFVPMETRLATVAFADGQVDAVAAYAPFIGTAIKRPGSKVLFSSKDFPGSISDHLVVTRKLITEHPEKVQALVNSWFATLNTIQANREKTVAIMAKREGVSVAEYKEYDKGLKIFTVAENIKAFQPKASMDSLPHAAAEMAKFLNETKLIKNKVDLSKMLDDRFVKAYAAQAPK